MKQSLLAALAALALVASGGEALASCKIKVTITNDSGAKVLIQGVDYKHNRGLGYSGLKHFIGEQLQDGKSMTVQAKAITVNRNDRVRVSVGYSKRDADKPTGFKTVRTYKKSKYQKCQHDYSVTIK